MQSVKLGKLPVKHDPRTLKLERFLAPSIPAAPVEMDWFSAKKTFGEMRNDDLGDCTIAGLGHLAQLWTGAMGSCYTPSDDIIVATYSKWCGYVPGKPSTDNGGVMLDVLNRFRQEGFAYQQLNAYVALDSLNVEHVKQAICLFGGVYVGIELPLSACRQDVWDVTGGPDSVPGSWGGHCVCIGGYDAKYLECITWGERKLMTWDFWRKYSSEAYALLQGDWQKYASPDFHLGNLQQALAEVTN